MPKTMEEIMHPGLEPDPAFPHAPSGWTRDSAVAEARREGLTLGDDHWNAVRALHEYFSRHTTSAKNARELHDALDERFHIKGGIKYLYGLFPGGPVAQGCRIAGLEAPAGVSDLSYGSVA
jgi:tRNA 2-thiouridine synthesizing protein E